MRWSIFLLVFILNIPLGGSQTVYKSKNGSFLSPYDTIRILNLYINIIYDQTPDRDPAKYSNDDAWKPGSPNKVNSNPPAFLGNFLDADVPSGGPEGIMTRLFYESSFGEFVVLGDFVVVDVAQSILTPDVSGANFSPNDLIKAAINIINNSGGLRTVYGHDSINDFDRLACGKEGFPKLHEADGRIDYLQVCLRNTGRKEEAGKLLYSYGQHNGGEGNTYRSAACNGCKIRIGNQMYDNEVTSVQNVGSGDLSKSLKSIIIHEFAHSLFGSNAFHASGGNHYSTSNPCVFMGLQSGYGLMGGYNSSLVSCNGYDRWRLGWKSRQFNTAGYPIAASGLNSDITNEDGYQTFILRDFVTTGDAIRICFPYVDSGAQAQYLWLENHQIGKNNKLDFNQYSNTHDCRPAGSAGIYAYIQVGKDTIESTNYGKVFPGDQCDNLKMIISKGNWDVQLVSQTDTMNCVAWQAVCWREAKVSANPFTGYSDQQYHFFDMDPAIQTINSANNGSWPWRSVGKMPDTDLPYMGDMLDAFTGHSALNLSSNPAAVNTLTNYVTQGGRKIYPVVGAKNNKTIYLTGLDIDMQDIGAGSFEIKIRWDQYSLSGNVRWTGNIIIKEKLIIEKGSRLLLDQGMTPVQVNRDILSGNFAPNTIMQTVIGSEMIIRKGSSLVLDQGSRLRIVAGSSLHIEKGAKIELRRNSVLEILKGANYTNGGAKLKKSSNSSIIIPD